MPFCTAEKAFADIFFVGRGGKAVGDGACGVEVAVEVFKAGFVEVGVGFAD